VTADVKLLCGTSATISSEEMTLKVASLLPQKTADVSCKFSPVMTTREPSEPLVGEIRDIWGRVVCAIATGHSVQIAAPQAIITIASRFSMCRAATIGASTGEDARAYIICLDCSSLTQNCIAVPINSRIGSFACFELHSYI
jgi:hypothetical protein